jgi:membrane protein
VRTKLKRLLRDFFSSIGRNQTFDLAAQLAYWALLALFPFAIFLLTVIGYLPLQGIDQEIMAAVFRVMPGDAAQLFDNTLHEVVGRQRGGLLVVALLGGLWSASGGVSALISALNRAYEVKETRKLWKVKLEALAITLMGVVLSVVAVTAMMIGPEIVYKIWNWFGLGGAFHLLWGYLRWPLMVFSLMILLAVIYWALPNVKHRFRLLSLGSVLAVLAWVLVSMGFNAYVAHFHAYARTYGTLGAAIVLITWLYMSGLLVILGGEINAAYERVFGERPLLDVGRLRKRRVSKVPQVDNPS